jgi:hypothetical protein
MILFLFFFLLDLDKLGFEELGIVNGANYAIACGAGVVTCLNA